MSAAADSVFWSGRSFLLLGIDRFGDLQSHQGFVKLILIIGSIFLGSLQCRKIQKIIPSVDFGKKLGPAFLIIVAFGLRGIIEQSIFPQAFFKLIPEILRNVHFSALFKKALQIKDIEFSDEGQNLLGIFVFKRMVKVHA